MLHSAALAVNNKIDFYDTPFDGHPRSYRNDLEGALKGEVQFVQTHSMAPESRVNYQVNEADQTKSQYMPSTVALREALILFMPEEGIDPITVDLVVTSPGKPEMTLSMAHPNDLPSADKTTALTYSKSAWSAVLPYHYVVNGLALEFIVDRDADATLSGSLPAHKIDIDRATEAVFFSTRIGMLTPPPGKDDNYWTLQDPILAATDYFQTLPASKIVFASYDDYELTQTIVNQNGKARVYDKDIDKHSDTTGDVYNGDMRENVGKSQISVGINLANSGITSWDVSQSYPKAQYLMTSHHAYGMYQCIDQANCPEQGYWRVEHGLSGGNGIGTIISTKGNEASHEWGHAYGLGHWPGSGLTEDCRWADHNFTSGWGFISHRNRMRNSVYGIATGGESREVCEYASPPNTPMITYGKGDYMFSRDAMSGGNFGGSPLSHYTFYSSFSARLIQQHLNGYFIPDTDYSSGYKQWDNETGDYQEILNPTLDGKPAPVPTHVGVPVVTILGGYDPDSSKYASDDEKRAVIYPAFYANYGNLYNLPAPDLSDGEDHCWVEVKNAAGNTQLVEVLNTRNRSNHINQLHFNLAQNFKPISATLNCRHDGAIKELAHTEFDGVIPELPPLAIVGQEHGIKQLMKREMAEITEDIMALAPNNIYYADNNLLIKINSYSYSDAELETGLTNIAWTYVKELRVALQIAKSISSVISYAQEKNITDDEQKELLTTYLKDADFITDESSFEVATGPMLGYSASNSSPRTSYISTDISTGVVRVSKDVTDQAEHTWVMDRQGKIHVGHQLDMCLVGTGQLTIAKCDNNAAEQHWRYEQIDNDPNRFVLKAFNGSCADLNNSSGIIERYNCHGNWNQRWLDLPQNTELWLALLPADTLRLVLDIMKPN